MYIDYLKNLLKSALTDEICNCIDNYEFEQAYSLLLQNSKTRFGQCNPLLTKLIIEELDINPLDFMSVVRMSYHRGAAISEINIPEGITKIEQFAFCDCYSLEKVTLPSTLKIIERRAFENCPLVSISFPKNLAVIEESAFSNTKLTNIELPNNLTTVGNFAFYNCKELTRISLPDSITDVGKFILENCTNLKDIRIPDFLNNEKGLFRLMGGSYRDQLLDATRT